MALPVGPPTGCQKRIKGCSLGRLSIGIGAWQSLRTRSGNTGMHPSGPAGGRRIGVALFLHAPIDGMLSGSPPLFFRRGARCGTIRKLLGRLFLASLQVFKVFELRCLWTVPA